MPRYLLDENVIRVMGPGGNAEVHAWLATVDASDLRVSAITFLEKRTGLERQRRKLASSGADTSKYDAGLAALDQFESEFGDRQVPIDLAIARETAAMLGAKDKNQRDVTIAATARVLGMVVVTRNLKDFVGRDVLVLDPFAAKPQIKRV
jgi:toxin FitB